MKMNFGLTFTTINAITSYPSFLLLNPIPSSTPKTFKEAIKIIEKLKDEKAQLNLEIKNAYEEMINANEEIPGTYKPELINYLRKMNKQSKLSENRFSKLERTTVETPSIRLVRFPTYWKLGFQFQGVHPALVVKYNKNQTRALVFPISHSNFSDYIIPIVLPYDKGRTSYILLDQFQNVCFRNIGPLVNGTLKDEDWDEIYKNFAILRTSIKP